MIPLILAYSSDGEPDLRTIGIAFVVVLILVLLPDKEESKKVKKP